MDTSANNHETTLKLYVNTSEAKTVKDEATAAGFTNMGEYLRYCVEQEIASRGGSFRFTPRERGGYRERKAKSLA